MKGYRQLAWPSTKRLQKDNFYWDEIAEASFQNLKEAMVSASVPVLAPPDFSNQFIVETNASGHGLGAVLMQEQCLVAHFSHALNSHNRSKCMEGS